MYESSRVVVFITIFNCIMSQVYATEPQTTGRVILETSHGPIDINLWCKECPTTTRMFLQLCLDGFYDSVVFHRIMENFLIQAGQVKFSGDGRKGGATHDIANDEDMKKYLLEHATAAESADGNQSSRRNLDVSPRIRFNHRGQVALALPLDEDVEGNASADALRSQFFITLDESSFLDGKHVIFGTVVGPTVFNALRIGKVAVEDETSRPIDMDMSPPIIKNVKIDRHIFDDLVPTADSKVPWKQNRGKSSGKSGADAGGESEVKKRRKKRKGKRDLNVLSFGEEMADDDIGGSGGDSGMMSSHDVLSSKSKFLSSSIDHGVKEAAANNDGDQPKKKRRNEEGRDYANNVDDFEKPSGSSDPVYNAAELKPREREHGDESYRERTKHFGDEPTTRKSKKQPKKKEGSIEKSKSGRNSEDHVSAVEARRAKYLKKGASRRAGNSVQGKSKREEDTMAKLFSFRSKVLHSKSKSGGDDKRGADDQTKSNAADNSLAARMAKRSLAENLGVEDDEAALVPTYRGQVLDDDGDEDHASSPAAWLKSQFKCRKHIDHAMDEEKGGDGRQMDDYVVVDSKGGGGRGENDDRRRSGQDVHRHFGGGFRGGGHHRHKQHHKHDNGHHLGKK